MSDIDESCEVVPSQRGHNKLVIRGFLYKHNSAKTRKNGDAAHYWTCEFPDCKITAITVFKNNEHVVEKFNEHDHTAEASRAPVCVTKNAIKRKATESDSPPAHIVQNAIASIDENVRPYLPSTSALKQSCKRVRKNKNVEPKTLDDLNLPDEYKQTLNNELFLIKEIDVDDNKVLIFSTVSNLSKMSNADYWLMDGTFNVVPNIFYQLYSIHAPVGPPERSRTLPLAYALMSSKSKASYDAFFEGLTEYAEEHDIHLNPGYIITDLEVAPIILTKDHFPQSESGVCLFHLGQIVYRKVQSHGLAKRYGQDENFSIFIRHITALAFLEADEIPPAWERLKKKMPKEAQPVVDWFDEYYVRGAIVRNIRNKEKRAAPKFPPNLWSVHDRMELNLPRTQNKIEAWHRRLNSLIGKSHVGVYVLIDELKKEQLKVEGEIECINRGEARPAMKRLDKQREERISQIFRERGHYNDVIDWIRGLAHNLKLAT